MSGAITVNKRQSTWRGAAISISNYWDFKRGRVAGRSLNHDARLCQKLIIEDHIATFKHTVNNLLFNAEIGESNDALGGDVIDE